MEYIWKKVVSPNSSPTWKTPSPENFHFNQQLFSELLSLNWREPWCFKFWPKENFWRVSKLKTNNNWNFQSIENCKVIVSLGYSQSSLWWEWITCWYLTGRQNSLKDSNLFCVNIRSDPPRNTYALAEGEDWKWWEAHVHGRIGN